MYINNFININSVLGKTIAIIIIIIASHHHIIFGIAALLFVISMNENIIEGMENNKSSEVSDEVSGKVSDKINQNNDANNESINIFRTNHCDNNKLMKDDTEITPDLIKDSFPNIKFNNDACNPCDLDCNFEIINSNDLLVNEENLKPQDSNNITVDREKITKKQEQ